MTTTVPEVDEQAEIELTEFTELDVRSIKGVGKAANGAGHLLLKGLADDAPADPAEPGPVTLAVLAKAMSGGDVDEAPDISTGRQVMTLLGQAIGAEAEELGAGHYDEVCDVRMLARAAGIIASWIAREKAVQAGQDPDVACGCCEWCSGIGCGCCPGCGSGMVMCSAAEEALEAAKSSAAINDLPDSQFGYIEPGGKKDAEGKTTPRSLRHFPLHDKKHVRLAVQLLSTSPFGDKAKGKVMAAAKREGIETDDDASKSAVAEGETTVQDDAQGSDALTKSVADAVTKALEPLKERTTALEGQLAKVLATPVPGGPVLARPAITAAGVNEDWAAKAADYREKAKLVSDPATADGYRALAREADEKARAAAPAVTS